jgi:hypothetical protein
MHGTYGIGAATDYLTATTQGFLPRLILSYKAGAKLRSNNLQIF